MMSEQLYATKLCLPDDISITLDHLSNSDLKVLVNLTGVDPVGFNRSGLLKTLVHEVHVSRRQHWTIDELQVRRLQYLLLSSQLFAANAARDMQRQDDTAAYTQSNFFVGRSSTKVIWLPVHIRQRLVRHWRTPPTP